MLNEIAKNIKDEVDLTLNRLFNDRKHAEGLVSVQNVMLTRLKRHVNEWYRLEQESAERIENMVLK